MKLIQCGNVFIKHGATYFVSNYYYNNYFAKLFVFNHSVPSIVNVLR
jgi:hypothetical protein